MYENWYLMNSKHDRISGFELDDFSAYATDGILELLENSPEAYDVIIEGVHERAIIQSIKDQNDERKIIAKIGSIKSGNMVLHKNKNWLIVTLEDDNRFYQHANMKRCFTTLRWLDSQGEIREVWFARKTDVSPNFGVDEGSRTMILPDERRQILVQSNQYTMEFKKEQRFIFDDRCWKIVTIDKTFDGLINIVLNESQINPATDNEELRIADYKPNVYSLKINNDKDISISKDQTLKLEVIATKNDIPVALDEIELSSSYPHVGTIDKQGLFTPKNFGVTTIVASYKGNVEVVNINVREITYNNFSVDIIGPDMIRSGQSVQYQIVFMNNGSPIDETASYRLTSEDGLGTQVATITEFTSNTVTIKADKKLLGKILLNVENSNKLISGYKQISIKSLI